MFTDLLNLIFKACETVNMNNFLFVRRVWADTGEQSEQLSTERAQHRRRVILEL